ncbi:MAG: glycosyltransferase [Chitinophagaceae bacterium]
MKNLIFTVTTDLTYDQRMIRICSSLAVNGYNITLVGRRMKSSIAITSMPFRQKRIGCLFQEGILMYLEYNLRLLFFLLFQKVDCICAIDLDTILACYFGSLLKKVTRVYDAHELFCEMKEIVNRPFVYGTWKKIEKFAVPKFKHGYTVNEAIADEFNKMYQVNYKVIRNITVMEHLYIPVKTQKFILYQGSVNEGRSFETLIPAMKYINCPLIICGDGNFMTQARQLVRECMLEEKIIFTGKLEPHLLKEYTYSAFIGTTIFENNGLNNYHSLANRFFDYLHAAVPQLCVGYPAYKEINNMYEVAVLTEDLSPESLAYHCNRLLSDESLYVRLQQNCIKAREILNWQSEERRLIDFYNEILN